MYTQVFRHTNLILLANTFVCMNMYSLTNKATRT